MERQKKCKVRSFSTWALFYGNVFKHGKSTNLCVALHSNMKEIIDIITSGTRWLKIGLRSPYDLKPSFAQQSMIERLWEALRNKAWGTDSKCDWQVILLVMQCLLNDRFAFPSKGKVTYLWSNYQFLFMYWFAH